MHYTVDPGLYALGTPGEKSPVLVTANYKMSFDQLREVLPGRNVWILVLDTKGINVWCAAGKGTFGTTELVGRIESSGLGRVVTHRELILPQLAGPGVAAHLVKKSSGFRIIYGPIRAKDLPVFLDSGLKATPEMRLKTFTIWERIVLIPVELVGVLKAGGITILILFLLAFIGWAGEGWPSALTHGLFSVLAILVAVLAGAVLTPSLLPWLPGRAFSIKGLSIGFCAAAILAAFSAGYGLTLTGRLEMLAWFFIIPAVSAFLAMNFTGASTFTSLSGVRKEMRWAVPLEIGAGVVGLVLWFGSHFIL
jgi:CO dehydrogenase/acetyl-CoA synthase delta subunit